MDLILGIFELVELLFPLFEVRDRRAKHPRPGMNARARNSAG